MAKLDNSVHLFISKISLAESQRNWHTILQVWGYNFNVDDVFDIEGILYKGQYLWEVELFLWSIFVVNNAKRFLLFVAISHESSLIANC